MVLQPQDATANYLAYENFPLLRSHLYVKKRPYIIKVTGNIKKSLNNYISLNWGFLKTKPETVYIYYYGSFKCKVY